MESNSPRQRNARIRNVLIAVLVLAGGAIWLARDQPRRVVEWILAGAVGGRVELGELRELQARRLVLGRLRITAIEQLPAIEVVTIEELTLEAVSARDLINGRFERMNVRGTSARLTPRPIELGDEPLPVTIDRLELEPAEITIADSGTVLTVSADLQQVGGQASGTIRVRSSAIELTPVLAFFSGTPAAVAGRFEDFDGSARFDGTAVELSARATSGTLAVGAFELELAGPRAELASVDRVDELTVEAERAGLRVGGRDTTLEAPRVEAVLTPIAEREGTLRLEIRPSVGQDSPLFSTAELTADFDPAARRLLAVEATLRALRLDPLFAGVEGEADLDFSGAGERLEYTLSARPRRLMTGAVAVDAAGASLEVRGAAPLPQLEDLERLRNARLPEVLTAFAGPLSADLSVPAAGGRWDGRELPATPFPLHLRFDGELAGTDPADRPPALRGRADLTAAGGRLTARGALSLGDVPAVELDWRSPETPLTTLLPLFAELGLPPPPADLRGLLAADGRFSGPLADPAVTADLALGEAAAEGDGWRLDGARARGRITLGGGRLTLRQLAAAGDLTVAAVGPLPLTLTADVRAEPGLAAGRIERAELAAAGLGRLRATGDWRSIPGSGIRVAGEISGEDLALDAWQEALRLEVADLILRGRLGAELAASREPDGAWRLAGPARLAGAGFLSTDGARVMEGLDVDLDLDLAGAPAAPTSARASGRTGGFLLLWDTFFGDFSSFESDLELTVSAGGATTDGAVAGDWRDRGARIGARLDVPGAALATAHFEQATAGDASRWSLRLDVEDLAELHQRYLREVFAGRFERPALGGALHADLGGQLDPETPTVAGEIRLSGFRWASAGDLAVAGLDLDLPLDLRLGATAAGEPKAGRLRFDRLTLGGVELPVTDSGLAVAGDSVAIEEPIELAILGGVVALEGLSLRRLTTPERYFETGLRLQGLSLDAISQALDFLPLEGTLDGRFPRVRLAGNDLEVEGGGEIALFGGTVRVRDISGEEVLTHFPKITLSAEFEDLDLGRLTRRIDFGEMTGILEGSIDGCELFRGVPVRCAAHFETVHKKGVSRTVDVKAINNLTILGTGQSLGFLDRGIRRFFKRYTYGRLAIDVRLAHDVLLLSGLERRGKRELFLRGRLPFPIDVVNAQPGKTVSFQTMLRRLQNLDFGAAKSEP